MMVPPERASSQAPLIPDLVPFPATSRDVLEGEALIGSDGRRTIPGQEEGRDRQGTAGVSGAQ